MSWAGVSDPGVVNADPDPIVKKKLEPDPSVKKKPEPDPIL